MRVKTIIFEIDNLLSDEQQVNLINYLENDLFLIGEKEIILEEYLSILKKKMKLEITTIWDIYNIDEVVKKIKEFLRKCDWREYG